MWHSQIESLDDGQVQRFVILQDTETLSYADVLQLWRDDRAFRSFFVSLLVNSPFEAYRWETPCVTESTLSRDFEFVLLRCDALRCDVLARRVDESEFASHFSDTQPIATFSNLGGNAVLVAPCPMADTDLYGHLASFIRNAPETQLHQLWISIAIAMEQRVSDRPVWLSTAGMGVSWLHVRLDDRPKYYGYSSYRKIA